MPVSYTHLFLRDEYGIGGLSYTGFDEWHDGKGIKLSREDDFSQGDYDTVRLSWNQVEKRIRGFVQNGRYLNEKEQAFLPEYEKDYPGLLYTSHVRDIACVQPNPQ